MQLMTALAMMQITVKGSDTAPSIAVQKVYSIATNMGYADVQMLCRVVLLE